MHELSLLENVREILECHARSQNFAKVTRVTLEIGKLSCVEPEALRFGFDAVMQGSLAEGAQLLITAKRTASGVAGNADGKRKSKPYTTPVRCAAVLSSMWCRARK